MVRRFTAIVLFAAAALTTPAAFTYASTAMARHCDSAPTAPAPSHDGMHHESPSPETGPCPHCVETACLMSTHCVDAGSSLLVVAAVSAVLVPATPRTPHPAPAFTSRTITPPTPPPLPSPIAS